MLISVKGTFQNGVALPSEQIVNREGQTVIITFLEEETETVYLEPSDAEREAGWDRLMQLIKQCQMDIGIEDLAYQHDHYLYGKPKQD